MKKRFIVCSNPSTDEQNKAFVEFLDKNSLNWWHWLANTWLIIDDQDQFTATTLRSGIKDLFPGIHMMVFELPKDGTNWAGYGPNGEDNNNMFTWIKNNWDT